VQRGGDGSSTRLGFSCNRERVDWSGAASNIEQSEVLETKRRGRTSSAFRSDDGSGLGQLLKAGRHVEHISRQSAEIDVSTSGHQQLTRVDADPDREVSTEPIAQVFIKRSDSLDHRTSSA
jgi:hypothetical protein